ncbi:MAG: hypothetical protein DWQ11_07130 [Proteobacteria bacterium]|nr:MAG: hypothetical protein DWQ11_07130 [Pseudomonadota bacterium]
MWLYRHHTCSEIIDLDHETGRWHLVDDSEKPAGARVLADLPVRGGYEVEGEKYYFSYWTDDGAFVFRTPENDVFEICRESHDGTITESNPGMRLEIEPAKYSDGRLRPGYSDVRLRDGNGDILYELSYNSDFYLRLYGSDFTAAATVQNLSDWDFFVALQGGIEIFAEQAATGRIEMTYNPDGSGNVGAMHIAPDDILTAESGDECTRAGVWAHTDDVRVTVLLMQGTTLPLHEGRKALWVWCRAA